LATSDADNVKQPSTVLDTGQVTKTRQTTASSDATSTESTFEAKNTAIAIGEYHAVTSNKAYFHGKPNVDTRRQAYLVKGETFIPLEAENGFVYVQFVNAQGVVTKGWLQSSDAALCTETNSKHVIVGKAYWGIENSMRFHNQPSLTSPHKAYNINEIVVPEKLQNGFAYVAYKDQQGNAMQGWVKQSQLEEADD
jgi:hypothetical protein